MLANLNNKKILITAGNSQIGNDIVSYFLKKNYCVYEPYRKKKNTIKSKRLKHAKYNFHKIEDIFQSNIPYTKKTDRGHIADSFMQVLGYLIYGKK